MTESNEAEVHSPNENPSAWLVKIYSNGGMLIDTRLEFTKPVIRSSAKTEFIPLFPRSGSPDLVEAMRGIEHFKDALNWRDDHLSKALRQWIEAGCSALSKATA